MTERISRATGGTEVKVIHNADHGLLSDLGECAASQIGLPVHPAAIAVREIRKLIGQVGEGGTVALWAHSQGGLVLEQALRHLTPVERRMLEVHTFGSAAKFAASDLRTCDHYVTSRDIALLFNPISLTKSFFSASSNIHILKSEGGGPIKNHSFHNPVYQGVVHDIGADYISRFKGTP